MSAHNHPTFYSALWERLRRATPPQLGSSGSLQLRVLRLGCLQDGDVGVGVFPDCEKNPG
jgi:hypothetical protein